jgi:hypothetical protein
MTNHHVFDSEQAARFTIEVNEKGIGFEKEYNIQMTSVDQYGNPLSKGKYVATIMYQIKTRGWSNISMQEYESYQNSSLELRHVFYVVIDDDLPVYGAPFDEPRY